MGTISSGIMLHLGKTEEIDKQFKEGYLRFSCPANWINYAKKQAPGIADRYEAIFAHVKKNDPRFGMICDDGYPLNYSRSLWNDYEPDGTVYARYLLSTLVPAICFYSISIKDAARHFGINWGSSKWLRADLQPYYKALNINTEEYSILAIRFPGKLVDELRREIPIAMPKVKNINKSNFNPGNPLALKYVKYDLDINKEFWDLHPYDELFRKRPDFRSQREVRMIIPNVSFTRDPVFCPEMYHDNELNIPVPNIQSYALICPASKCDTIRFEKFNEDFSLYDILFYKRQLT